MSDILDETNMVGEKIYPEKGEEFLSIKQIMEYVKYLLNNNIISIEKIGERNGSYSSLNFIVKNKV